MTIPAIDLGGEPFRLLSLDGGGSKGVYTLGVLKELEAYLNEPLWSYFHMVFGTSTGAIIASLIALGLSIKDIENHYFDLIPKVMRHKRRSRRTAELRAQARAVFGDKRFDAFKTGVGLVATNYDLERPILFKSLPSQAHSRRATFEPGLGCTIAEAVVASAAAFPFFDRVKVVTRNQGTPELMDGGFVANNPTLFALADVVSALGVQPHDIRVLSVGVGHYKEPQRSWYSRLVFSIWPFQMINKMFASNTNTIEAVRQILFPQVRCVRIDESYPDAQYETDMLESDATKLRKLNILGRESYAKHEKGIRETFTPRPQPLDAR